MLNFEQRLLFHYEGSNSKLKLHTFGKLNFMDMRILLLSVTAFQLISLSGLSQGGGDVLVEQVDQRDMYSKTFLKNNMKTVKEIAGGPIHYQEGNQWLPIDQAILPSGEALFPYQNSTNVIKSAFPAAVNASSKIRYVVDGASVFVQAEKKLVSFSEIGGFTLLNETTLPNQAVVENNTITFQQVYQGINDRYEVANATIKNEVIMDQLPSSFTSSSPDYFGFEEQFYLPAGWAMNGINTDINNLTSGPIEIRNDLNEVVLLVPSAVFYDSGNESNDGSSLVQGKFHISLSNGIWKLTTLVPAAWLQDPNRSFPITLDPTVTINGTTGGWQSQNNYVDSDFYIFVGVCCGNLQHRGWIKFNTTGIPDNSCVTDVQLRVYVNGVGAATAELTHVQDVTGQFGPYGAINPAAYTDIGNGYYTSFTMTGTGYYGYYDLGPNADALLQSQLVGNWFQVGLKFDNEPSINWKRITGTSSSIFVEYSAPPCVVLPVGLTDFEVSCEDDVAQLNWTTATEQQSAYFTISRSYDGVQFEEVKQIQAAGNSQEIHNYAWSEPLLNDRVTYYRLSQTDLDGEVVTYPTRSIATCDDETIDMFVDASGQLHIEGENIQMIQIRDDLGRVIRYTTVSSNATGSILETQVTSGIYQVVVWLADGTINTKKVYLE